MKKILTLGAVSALSMLMATSAFSATYKITITNTMGVELIAPIVVVATAHDNKIFSGNYVTAAAEEQILTGDPAKLVGIIGSDASVATGTDGPPGVLLAPGKSITFELETKVTELRFFAMVAPTEVPDHYLTTVVTLPGMMDDDMMDDDMANDDMMDDDDMDGDDMDGDDMDGDDMMDGDMASDDMDGDDMMDDDMSPHSFTAEFSRYDIGHDEGTKTITQVEGMGFGTIEIERL
ncbi:MAG: hypothetical protein L3J13_03650 [Devosiaceae bacterium]|nr:hypothetical protein [Devosiaceae bacterium]